MKKRILWVSMCAPSEHAREAGAKTLNYYINEFSKENEVVLLAKLRTDEYVWEEEPANYNRIFVKNHVGLRRFWDCVISLNSKFNPLYKYGNTLMKATYNQIRDNLLRLKKAGYSPDVVILEWTEMAMFIDVVKKIFPNAKYVSSEHDISYIGLERKINYYSLLKKAVYKVKYMRKKKNEIAALSKADLVLVQNTDNKNVLISEGISQDKVVWLCPYFEKPNLVVNEDAESENRKIIMFFGAMGRPENYMSAIWFIENVVPRLDKDKYKFVVLGSNPPELLKRFSSEDVEITGFVDDVNPFFQKAYCLVAPLVMGAGIKVKVLEGFAYGLPVLTNEIGIEGIDAEKEVDYIHCESPDDYINALENLSKGIVEINLLRSNSRKLVEEKYDLELSFKRYKESIYSLF